MSRLPKTRSGKTLRLTVKNLVENASQGKFDAEAVFPPTIEDVTVVEEARQSINEWMRNRTRQQDRRGPKAKL